MVATRRSWSVVSRSLNYCNHSRNQYRQSSTQFEKQQQQQQSVGADIVKGPSLLRTSIATRPRPSLLHLPGLRTLPVWTQYSDTTHTASESNRSTGSTVGQTRVAYNDPTVTSVVHLLEANWEAIWTEYRAVAPNLKSDYQPDTEHSTLHHGHWDWHSYMAKGIVSDATLSTGIGTPTSFATHFPVTAAVLAQLRTSDQLFEGTPFGYSFFSTLHGSSKIAPHSAPMNLRLRIHLALSVPNDDDDNSNDSSSRSSTANSTTSHKRPLCGMRIGGLTRKWQTGKCLVIDDAYEHEVWNESQDPRVVLLVDIWHPDIVQMERLEIVELFATAKQKGWLT